MKKIAVAIDGPGGAGKSTISKAVAKRLGIIYVDTGALYRTVGYYAREHGLSVEESKVSELITPMLEHINIEIAYVDGAQHVILNGEDLGDKIRQPDISMYASACSSVGNVRAFLLEAQKKLARENFAELAPTKISVLLEYSHPPLDRRVKMVEKEMKKLEKKK